MSETTINTSFDIYTLPATARDIPAVVWLCRCNHEFRIEVIERWNDSAWRMNLIKRAQRHWEAR